MEANQWPIPCRAAFREMMKTEPLRLVEWVRSGVLVPYLLSEAAEALAGVPTSDDVVGVLLGLSKHPTPGVREGSIYGFIGHLSGVGVVDRLRQMIQEDESPGVREAAKEVLYES